MLRQSLLAATLALSAGLSGPAAAEPLSVTRFGLYVLADDVARAKDFYEGVFGVRPEVQLPTLVGFNISGGFFAIASRTAYAPDVSAGGSVRPYIRVSDLEGALARVRALPGARVEDPGIVQEGDFSFFRFLDSEGNVVEFFDLEPAVAP